MFDRCDADTKAVLDTGLAEAKRLGHNWLGTEHLLLALTIHSDHLPEPVAQLLPSDAEVRVALTAVLAAGHPAADAELLASLGIDLDEVRAAVRDNFGPEALDRLAQRQVHQPWQPWRRPNRACVSLLSGRLSVAPRVKEAFEHALDDATRRQRPTIDPAGLLLGIVEVEDALANRLLRDVGVAPGDVRIALHRAAAR